MELKLSCDCGQKYKFDVEPVNNQMPFTVACPICKRDGTAQANAMLQQMAVFRPIGAAPAPIAPPPASIAPMAPPPPFAGAPRLRINAEPPAAQASMPPVQSAPLPPLPPGRQPMPRPLAAASADQPVKEFNLGLGILGAFLGAAVGIGLMYGFYSLVGFRFPLLGVGIGFLTGLGGKLMYKGTSNAMGMIAGGIALVAVVGTLFLMYGTFPIISIISVAVSVSFAYRIAGAG